MNHPAPEVTKAGGNDMIEVKRYDYPAKTKVSRRTGKEITTPARYYCYYYYKGKEIAQYSSMGDVLALNTDYIGTNFSLKPYDRALKCRYKDAYQYLFAMLNVDRTTRITDYIQA